MLGGIAALGGRHGREEVADAAAILASDRLTVTDEGCSTTFVYTGQSATCDGGTSAVHKKRIRVARARS